MSATPRVSALVPVYNGARYLVEAVESAMAQTMPDLEVIIIDDGSSDESGSIADRLADQYPERVRALHQANCGLVAARNAGLAVASGQYIALLDADDAWYPHHLAEAVDVLDRRPEVGLVHAQYEVMDADSRSEGTPPGRWSVQHKSAWDAIFLWQDHVMQVTAVFRRSLVDEVGPFDPQFNRLGCEDRDMWLRIAARSELVFLPNVHARYRVHGANMSKQFERMNLARMLLVDKHSQSGRGRALRSLALASLAAANGYGARTRGEFADARAWYRQALRHYPWSFRIWKAAVGAVLGRR